MYKSKKYILVSLVSILLISGGFFLSKLSAQKQVSDDQEIIQPVYYFTPPPLPEVITFANEKVPLQNFDTRESLDRELLSISYFHSQTILMLKKLPRYFKIIEPVLKKNNIPEDFKYLALAESHFSDRALSPVGAAGIWQFMPATAKGYGLEVSTEVDERYHIEKATQAACNYLNDSFNVYKNWTMVAASYNAGMNGINRQVEMQKSSFYYDLFLNDETARYLFRILALKMVMTNPEAYGFRVEDKDKYPVIPTKFIEVAGPVENLTTFALRHNINYKILKYFNPWLRQTDLKNPRNKKYMIKIPQPGFREFTFEDQGKAQK